MSHPGAVHNHTIPSVKCASTRRPAPNARISVRTTVAGSAASGSVSIAVTKIAAGTLPAVPQPEAGVTYARKLAREEGRIDFGEPAVLIERRLRALNPAPGCWCEARGERLALLAGEVVDGAGPPGTVLALPLTVACGDDALSLNRVQRAGKRPMTTDELQRGFPLPVARND